jgi:hypothetical protein
MYIEPAFPGDRGREVINDVAGMRRFVEVLTKPKHLAARFD